MTKISCSGLLLMIGVFIMQGCDQHNANQHMNKSKFEQLVQRFEDPSRAEWQKPDQVIASLGDLSGKTVAEIGTGTGYFALRIARVAQKVIAIDIDQRFLDYIGRQLQDDTTLNNVELRLATEDDPLIKPLETDIILLVNTYHHIENRVSYFERLRRRAKTGSRLMIVDFRKGEHPVGPPHEIKLDSRTVAGELRSAGYAQIQTDSTTLPYQYIIMAIAGESMMP